LGLLWGPADLNDHRRGNQRNYARFQTDLVFSPRPALVSVGGVRSCARTLRRASAISSGVKRPCCFSHSSTAARPARRLSASRAAVVIQAETLALVAGGRHENVFVNVGVYSEYATALRSQPMAG